MRRWRTPRPFALPLRRSLPRIARWLCTFTARRIFSISRNSIRNGFAGKRCRGWIGSQGCAAFLTIGLNRALRMRGRGFLVISRGGSRRDFIRRGLGLKSLGVVIRSFRRRLRAAPGEGQAGGLSYILVNYSALHYEYHAADCCDVLQRISV